MSSELMVDSTLSGKITAPPAEVSEPHEAGASRIPPLLGALLILAACFILFLLLYKASVHAFGGNSDGATVVLEGESIRLGHLTLNGWDLSLDSFWTVDALLYAVGVGLIGTRLAVMHLVPTGIALAVIVVGAAFAKRRPGLSGWCGVLAVVALLGLPSPILAFFFLQGPWHIGTALWALIAYGALARGRFGLRWVVACCFIAAGLLGDLQMLLLGAVPAALAGLAAMLRTRSIRRGLPSVSAAIAGCALAYGVRQLAERLGTFAIATSFDRAHPSQYRQNLWHILSWGSALLGGTRAPVGPAPALSTGDVTNGQDYFHVLRFIAMAVLVLAVLYAIVRLAKGLWRANAQLGEMAEWHLDDLLLFGLIADLVLFVAVCPNGNADYARYLTAGVIFAVILTGRVLARLVATLSRRGQLAASGIAVAFCLAFAAEMLVGFHENPAPQPAIGLGSFLEEHHLLNGIGDYWSASIVTVASSGKVAVRPVIVGTDGHFVRYGRQSDARWYASPFTFFVYDTARPWRDVNTTSAVESYGTPTHTYAVGTYRVLTWKQPIRVSALGYTRS